MIRRDRTLRFGNDPLAELVCLTCKSSGKSCDYSTTYFPNPPPGGQSFVEMEREDNATGGSGTVDSVETLSYFIRQCQGTGIPFTDVWTTKGPHRPSERLKILLAPFDANLASLKIFSSLVQTIENNALLRMRMRSKLMPKVKFMRVTLDDGTGERLIISTCHIFVLYKFYVIFIYMHIVK